MFFRFALALLVAMTLASSVLAAPYPVDLVLRHHKDGHNGAGGAGGAGAGGNSTANSLTDVSYFISS